MGRLTDVMVKQATPRAVAYEEPDGQDNLRLVVYPSGKKSWAVRYRNASGTVRKVTLGPVERTSLKDARKWAKQLMVQVQAGHDPGAKEKPAPDAETVESAFKKFMVARRAQDRNRSADEVQRQFDTYIEPAIGARILKDLTGEEARKPVLALLDAGSRLMANRLHATIARFLKWCAEPDQGLLEASPYTKHRKPADERTRDRVLSNAELAAVWHAAAGADQPFGSIVRLLILTAQRRSEVAEMVEIELDLNARRWTIPSHRAKNGDRHVVPLSEPAIAELAAVKRVKGKAGFVFTATGEAAFANFGRSKLALDKVLNFNEAWRLHDLRRTATSGMAALGIPAPVVEAILNHRTGTRSGVAGVYNRHRYLDEAELALRAWGRFVTDIVAHDARRTRCDAMRAEERARLRAAVQDDDCAWQAYLTALDASEDAGEPEAVEAAA